MKKLTLTLAGLMVLGSTIAMADGSKVEANKNVNLNIVNKSTVTPTNLPHPSPISPMPHNSLWTF